MGAYVVSPLSQKGGSRDPLILYSNRVKDLPLFVLAMTITLGVYKRHTMAIYPVSAVISISEGKQEADGKCLEPTYLLSQESSLSPLKCK